MKKIDSLILKVFAVMAFVLFSAPTAEAATMNFVLEKEEFTPDETFSLDLKVDSEGVGVNAAEGTIKFPPNLLEVKNIDRTGSIFNFWLEDPTFSNDRGEVRFIGGSTAGYSGKSLQILKIIFRVKGTGTASVSVTDGAITASDGSGTNVFVAGRGVEIRGLTRVAAPGVIQIERPSIPAAALPAAPKIEVPLYPDEKAWYSTSTRFLTHWELPRDVINVATIIDKNPASVPSKAEGLFDNKIFPPLADGIWYIHTQFRNSVGWGPVSHYRIAIDTSPPLPFTVSFSDGLKSDNPSPVISYMTADQPSGVVEYEVRLDSEAPVIAKEALTKVDPLFPGNHTVRIIARDVAGNSAESTENFEVVPIESPVFASVPKSVFIGEGGLITRGTVTAGRKVLVILRDRGGEYVDSAEGLSDDKGNWSVEIDRPLSGGVYYAEAVSIDTRGARSLPVRSENVRARVRPLLIINGIGITPAGFYVAIILIFAGAFFAGRYYDRRMSGRRSLRIALVNRDIMNMLELIKRDISKASDSSDAVGNKVGKEIHFLLSKATENIDKMNRYVTESIEEIDEK